MKKLFLIITTISFCFFIVLISFEFFLRAIPNDFTHKKYFFNQKKENIETLILGSSHAFVGINPEKLKTNAFSLAYSSQTLDLDEQLFEKYKSDLPQLKTLIIPVSYFSYVLALEDGSSANKIKNYNIYYPIYSHTFLLKNNAEVFHQSLDKNWNKLIRALQNPYFQITVDQNGFIDKRFLNNKLTWNKKVDHAIKNHSKSVNDLLIQQRISQNSASLERIISWCDEKNIKVILVSTPTDKAYLEGLNSEQLRVFEDITQQLTNKYPNVIWLNFLENSSDFMREDFQDPDHLSAKGADKLSEKINFYL